VAPPRKHGLVSVRRYRKDGTFTTTYYHRKSRIRLGNDFEEARRLSAEIDRVHGTGERDTFGGLVTRYLSAPEYQSLTAGSRRTYRVYLDRLRETFAALPVVGLTRPVVLALRDSLAGRPSVANQTIKTLRVLLQWAVDRGELASNPAARAGTIATPPRGAVWSDADIAAFRDAAPPPVRLAFELLLGTAQRPGDVLALTWQDVAERDGRLWITLRQQKTRKPVTIPCTRGLEAALVAAGPKPIAERQGPIVPSPKGKRWELRNFSRVWDEAAVQAGVGGLQRRDLRRTAMVMMAREGASEKAIASVSGHDIERTRRILDTYIPRDATLALAGIKALEAAKGYVTPLQNVRGKKSGGGPGRTRTCNQTEGSKRSSPKGLGKGSRRR
jgi:integrase